jgi:MFS family permease
MEPTERPAAHTEGRGRGVSMVGISVPFEPATRVSPHRIFWAAWAGWMLDGFDSATYGLLLVSAFSELLPLSGMEASKANIAIYGGYGFAIFMLGWACAMFWGWLADRIGRVRTMCLTILAYSIFTALSGFAFGAVSFLVLRFLVGFGVGGEWAAGTPLLHESVPESMRVRLAGWLHTATPVGIILASVVALVAVPYVGWRGLFMIGILPALLAIYLRTRIPEPPRSISPKQASTVRPLFTGKQAIVTWAAALMIACGLLGVWSSSFWIPTVVATKYLATGHTLGYAQQLASSASLATNVGTLLGCLLVPWIATIVGSRKGTAAIFFIGSLIANVLAYYVILNKLDDVRLFLVIVPVLGFFTNGVFALFTIWLPELFASASRGSGLGFTFSLGRILAAAGPFLIGAITAQTGSYPLAITFVSAIYIPGLLCIAFCRETAGKPLPA